MSMVTSCPACTTTFRVTPEQLKKREGKVRCGKCSGIFDAFKSLTSLPDDAAQSSEAVPSATPATAAPAVSATSREGDGERVQRFALQGALDISGPSAVVGDLASNRSQHALVRKRRRFWASVVGVLVLLLGLQLVYAMRDEIAGTWPAAQPNLARICKTLGCTVSFPRRIEQLAIESSDLQTDPQRPSIVVLTATLRNRGSSLVAHPALELTLTNAQDQAVARRVFQPADYLADPAAGVRGMAGVAEVHVRIALDTGDLNPAGYRLFLFYP